MIDFQNVTKKFKNSTLALQDINLKINPREFVFIIGPSGSGKTTFLRLMLREVLPSSGKILIEGKDIAEIKKIHELRRKIGAAFQDFKLLFDRTLAENISLILESQNTPLKKIQQTIDEVLELVGLTGKKELFPLQLAGGELQRAVIARALALNPSIIFADEPTGNLDPESAWQIVKLLKDRQKEGKTVIMATHNVEVVNTLSERVVRLDKGKIISDQKDNYEGKEEKNGKS